MRIIIKPGVDFKLNWQILYGSVKALQLASEMKATEIRFTSGYRKKRGKLNSFHQVRLAVDFVVEGVPIATYRNKLKQRLDKNYDIIYHDAGTGEHFHMEWDEK